MVRRHSVHYIPWSSDATSDGRCSKLVVELYLDLLDLQECEPWMIDSPWQTDIQIPKILAKIY